jgi:hypothetical protein
MSCWTGSRVFAGSGVTWQNEHVRHRARVLCHASVTAATVNLAMGQAQSATVSGDCDLLFVSFLLE